MGEEIKTSHFTEGQFRQFGVRLSDELRLLKEQINDSSFNSETLFCGFETEAWLLNNHLNAAPVNNKFLALAQHPLLDHELAQFNFEINSSPRQLTGYCLSQAERELDAIWQHCELNADKLDHRTGLFGILPTLKPGDLSLKCMSESNRYAALNEQLLVQRQGRPLKVDISGHQHLRLEHRDVMLESAATSFQLHLQIPANHAAAYFNTALQISSAMVGIAANSCFLFGKHLFSETRIPLFEQAVEIGGFAGAAQGPLKRVGFGSAYLKDSIIELFEENIQHFPVLLPILFDEPASEFRHLRLHNGTIWRWNRPLIGDHGSQHHIRIEHRSIPAGPTRCDMFANAAFFYGLLRALVDQHKANQEKLPFATAKDNFYKAAHHGLDAKVRWLSDRPIWLKKLVTKTLIPLAHEGLTELGIATEDVDLYLDIIRGRAESGQTGTQWQSKFLQHTGGDMHLLTETYLHNQSTNMPVHKWELPEPPSQIQAPVLNICNSLPADFFDTPANKLYEKLDGPTLFTLAGRSEETVFISVLLHGNEDSGLMATQELLKKYQDKPLPRTIYLFIGNIEAARYRLRRLNGQHDYNRTWPHETTPACAESKLLQQVYDLVKQRPLFVSIDIHNNTGINPQYACVNKLDPAFLNLALLFSRIVVYFTRPHGVQSLAFSKLCPAVTIECGKAGDQTGVSRAKTFIDTCLNLTHLPDTQVTEKDIDLYHTVAQVKVLEHIRFNFEDEPADIHFNTDLEHMNFREITIGTPFGDCVPLDSPPLSVINEHGEDVYAKYFDVKNGILSITRQVMPSMITLDEQVIRQDCFCYLMERIQP